MGGEMESEGRGLEWRINTGITTGKDGAACPTLGDITLRQTRAPGMSRTIFFEVRRQVNFQDYMLFVQTLNDGPFISVSKE